MADILIPGCGKHALFKRLSNLHLTCLRPGGVQALGGNGGAISLEGDESTVLLHGIHHMNNIAKSGGAVSIMGSNVDVNLQDCVFDSNSNFDNHGGGVKVGYPLFSHCVSCMYLLRLSVVASWLVM